MTQLVIGTFPTLVLGAIQCWGRGNWNDTWFNWKWSFNKIDSWNVRSIEGTLPKSENEKGSWLNTISSWVCTYDLSESGQGSGQQEGVGHGRYHCRQGREVKLHTENLRRSWCLRWSLGLIRKNGLRHGLWNLLQSCVCGLPHGSPTMRNTVRLKGGNAHLVLTTMLDGPWAPQ